MDAAILLFDDFETLDVFGPVEILGRIKDHYRINFFSEGGKVIHNQHGIAIHTNKLDEIRNGTDIFLIPGGPGTRLEVENHGLLEEVRKISEASQYVMTVCTGSALLACTGLLNGKRATSNKKAFDWVSTYGKGVQWIRQARWTVDGKYYTSSGVSAGMDMTFGFLSDKHGADFARRIAFEMEYQWQEDMTVDPFVRV